MLKNTRAKIQGLWLLFWTNGQNT